MRDSSTGWGDDSDAMKVCQITMEQTKAGVMAQRTCLV